MITITILCVGKTKEKWLEEQIAEYQKRASRWCRVVWKTVSSDRELLEQKNAIALDPQGKLFSSEEFAGFLEKRLVEGGSRLTFFIGGAEGLPEEVRRRFELVSLSPLTFTHQMTRLILAEQIYRSATIWAGVPYHK